MTVASPRGDPSRRPLRRRVRSLTGAQSDPPRSESVWSPGSCRPALGCQGRCRGAPQPSLLLFAAGAATTGPGSRRRRTARALGCRGRGTATGRRSGRRYVKPEIVTPPGLPITVTQRPGPSPGSLPVTGRLQIGAPSVRLSERNSTCQRNEFGSIGDSELAREQKHALPELPRPLPRVESDWEFRAAAAVVK